MVHIETTSSLGNFRKFIISSTCKSFIPNIYNRDPDMFPEREDGLGDIYIEAANKFRVKKLKEITFVNAKEIFGIIYSSKTGSTILKWRQINKKNGKVMGEASNSSLSNLVESGVLTKDWLNQHINSQKHMA